MSTKLKGQNDTTGKVCKGCKSKTDFTGKYHLIMLIKPGLDKTKEYWCSMTCRFKSELK